MRRVLPGFVLIEVAFALLIIGFISTISWHSYQSYLTHRSIAATDTRMEQILKALACYVRREGRLPCPSNDESGMGPSSPLGCPTNRGFVPYRTLNLNEGTLRDGWGRSFVYAVDQAYHVAKAHIDTYENKIQAFCEVTPSEITIYDSQEQPTTTHPSVVLMSHGPSGQNNKTSIKSRHLDGLGFIDCAPSGASDDIVKFVTSDHLLAFYGGTNCPNPLT